MNRAFLIEMDSKFDKPKPDGKRVEVQFNPETLKVTYSNQITPPPGGDQSSGNPGLQFVGRGTTKLALQLWFDVTAMTDGAENDVRRLTHKVIYFMTPQKAPDGKKQVVPPVQFLWGSFKFDGVVESLEETLEYFSPEGIPLRAGITLGLVKQTILEVEPPAGKAPATPGQQPMTPAPQNKSLQDLAKQGGNPDWQSIAAANAIEDPLRLKPGRLLDLNASVSVGASVGANVGLRTPASPVAAASGLNLNGSLGGASGSLSVS
jgi:hypothetical protein